MNFDAAIKAVKDTGLKPPTESVRQVGGVVVRSYVIPAGTMLVSHVHSYDHASYLLSGSGILGVDGVNTELTGPCMVEIKANTEHAFYAFTDCKWDCVHAFDLARSDAMVMEGVE